MEQAPGPIIANVVPRVAKTMGIEGLPPPAKTIHSSLAAMTAPATGVHKPTRSSIPAPAAIICGTIDAKWLSPRCPATQQRRTVADNNRWSRRPRPGQPFGNVENKRCNRASLRHSQQTQNGQKEVRSSFFRGAYSSMIPRFRPIVTAWARSFAPSFESMLATWLFTLASPTES